MAGNRPPRGGAGEASRWRALSALTWRAAWPVAPPRSTSSGRRGRVAGSTGRELVVVAEAGIGKTRIVAARLADIDELGVWSFEGGTDELEQRRPCGVIADCR